MAKLYTEVTGSHGGRIVGKSDDRKLMLSCRYQNSLEYTITYTEKGIKVEGDGGVLLDCTSERM